MAWQGRRPHRTGDGTKAAIASASAAGASTGTHVFAPGTTRSVASGKSAAASRARRRPGRTRTVAPDEQDRPVEVRDRLGGVEEQLRAEARHGRDEVVGHPRVASRRPEERVLRSGSSPGAATPATSLRRAAEERELQPDARASEPGEGAIIADARLSASGGNLS